MRGPCKERINLQDQKFFQRFRGYWNFNNSLLSQLSRHNVETSFKNLMQDSQGLYSLKRYLDSFLVESWRFKASTISRRVKRMLWIEHDPSKVPRSFHHQFIRRSSLVWFARRDVTSVCLQKSTFRQGTRLIPLTLSLRASVARTRAWRYRRLFHQDNRDNKRRGRRGLGRNSRGEYARASEARERGGCWRRDLILEKPRGARS